MHRQEVREKVWKTLRTIAKPDSRFHFDFNEYIPDFEGSDIATQKLIEMECYQQAQTIFITPDNCLELFRAQTFRDQKTQIMSTYGIRRGLVELTPKEAPVELADYIVQLDLIEKVGHSISLKALRQKHHLDLVVTGGSVVNYQGVRFGKGHGFFDLEWAFLYMLGVVDVNTPVIAFVHDCQVIDIKLDISPFDTVCDYIITPTQVIHVQTPQKPETGVIWDCLNEGMFESIPPLQEIKIMQDDGDLNSGF